MSTLVISAVVFALGSAFTDVSAQPPARTPPPEAPRATEPDAKNADTKSIPPALQLGIRVEQVRQTAGAGDVLIIVSDAESYLEALARWTHLLRFPVLIDDGSHECREDIARFARGYKPAKTVRWTHIDREGAAPVGAESFARADVALIHKSIARAWGLAEGPSGPAALLEHWKKNEFKPLGIVLADAQEPAWTGGVALAAGRGQVLSFTSFRHDSPNVIWPHEADKFAAAAEQAAEVTGLPWRELGDALESITLCTNAPARLSTDKGEFFALTDRVGRFGKGFEIKERWAYTGQLLGSASRSAYNAMCALFLQPRNAWVFDGYPESQPWSAFDGTQSAELLRKVSIETELFDTPKNSAADWRTRLARPVNAGLVLINSKGNADFFELEPGRCQPGDTPILSVPAMVHMVHSWSATTPLNPNTVAGRWIDHGAFVYVGSVHEPYLNAFVPTPFLVKRLLAAAPIGAAARIEPRELWKITILGDPLYTLGPAAKRSAQTPEFAGAKDITEGLREWLEAGQYAEALRALVLSGRDEDAARLSASMLKDKPGEVSPEVAAWSVLPLMRQGYTELVPLAFAKLDSARRRERLYRDALWLASEALAPRIDPVAHPAMTDGIRPDHAEHDAMLYGACVAKSKSVKEATDLLREAAAMMPDSTSRQGVERAIRAASEWRQ